MIHISDKHNCCGCGVCGDICHKQAISFHYDEEGFWYPKVDPEKCVECGLCERVCPFINTKHPKKPLSCFAAINPNEKERMNSSSGGIFSMLMNHTIKGGGIVFGAAFTNDWMVHHVAVENNKDAESLRGSKYVQSNLEGIYQQVLYSLKHGKKVLFSGTACQIAALKNYLGKDYDNLLTVDVVCHGVPSPGVWKEYMNTLRRPKGAVDGKNTVLSSLNEMPSIEGISFRDKQDGWKKFGFVVRYSTDQREVEKFGLSSVNDPIFREPHISNLYMQGFIHNLYLRPSCHRCKVKSGRCGSDLTLGDFWGIWNELPQADDNKGTTLLLINTPKGKNIIETIKPDLWEVKYEQGFKYNLCLEESVPETKCRSIFMQSFQNGEGLKSIPSLLQKMQPSFLGRALSKLKRLIIH